MVTVNYSITTVGSQQGTQANCRITKNTVISPYIVTIANVWSLFIIKIRQWHISKIVSLSRPWQKRKRKTKNEQSV